LFPFFIQTKGIISKFTKQNRRCPELTYGGKGQSGERHRSRLLDLVMFVLEGGSRRRFVAHDFGDELSFCGCAIAGLGGRNQTCRGDRVVMPLPP
jgi:hypothetical protein